VSLVQFQPWAPPQKIRFDPTVATMLAPKAHDVGAPLASEKQQRKCEPRFRANRVPRLELRRKI
jgi:hypothetical protein